VTVVGSCGKAHGIRGEISVYTEVPDVFVPDTRLTTPDGGGLTVAAARPHKGHLIVAFAEIGDRNGADRLRNTELSIDAELRPDLNEDEFWVSDLVGLQVQDRNGSQLGIIRSVVTTEAQDRLIIDTGHSQVEVPFVPELVPDVLESHIVVDPPEGLFD
jgi:16S rRNA processing protein RimM